VCFYISLCDLVFLFVSCSMAGSGHSAFLFSSQGGIFTTATRFVPTKYLGVAGWHVSLLAMGLSCCFRPRSHTPINRLSCCFLLGLQLYVTDPSGNYSGWKAACIGQNNQVHVRKLAVLTWNCEELVCSIEDVCLSEESSRSTFPPFLVLL
jgi:hypothetical protein